MTIKELENRTGMTRANIRFYEGEGLLSPKRLDNGYRDYSEEDARTLEKIKLLRQLQLDIDTIRQVQRGSLTLEQALFTQMNKLEGDKALIERAAEVCRTLERSRVEYAALEPQPYLQQLEAPGRSALPEPAVQVKDEDGGGAPARYHPWMRLFARGLDMALYDMLINVVWLLISRDQGFLKLQTQNLLGQWVWGLLMLILALALEPFWLHCWGWTPGKWVFGLKLRNEDGSKLSLADARGRCWDVLSAGYGWNIPIMCQYRMWRSREMSLNGECCDWEWGYRYTREYRRFSGPVFAAAGAACMAVLQLASMWSVLPPCRGNLTVAEFCQNYNHFCTMLERSNYAVPPTDGPIPQLDDDGHWVGQQENFDGPMVGYGTTTTIFTSDGPVYIKDPVAGTTVWDELEFTVEDGRVTAVTLRMETRDSLFSGSDFSARSGLVLLAMTGAVEGLNLFNYDLADWGGVADETLAQWEDMETDYRGLHVSQQVEYTGYDSWVGNLHGAVDGNVPNYCEKTVTISLIE